jgi:hypothetical protein
MGSDRVEEQMSYSLLGAAIGIVIASVIIWVGERRRDRDCDEHDW